MPQHLGPQRKKKSHGSHKKKKNKKPLAGVARVRGHKPVRARALAGELLNK
jgi:hypothetical protein